MHFADTKGRRWDIAITCGTVLTLERSLGIKVLDVRNGWIPAMADFKQVVDILWEVVRPQAEAKGIEMLDFLEAVDGPTLMHARELLHRAYIDFFPTPTRRELLERLWSAMEELRLAIAKRIEIALASIVTASSGSASTPAQASSA